MELRCLYIKTINSLVFIALPRTATGLPATLCMVAKKETYPGRLLASFGA